MHVKKELFTRNGTEMKKEPYGYPPLWILLISFLMFLCVFTLSPFDFSRKWLIFFTSHGTSGILQFLFHLDPSDMINNTILFVPFGWILHSLAVSLGFRRSRWFWIPLASGVLTSACIEITQLFLNRATSVIDVATNSIGTIFGFFSARQWQWDIRIVHFIRKLFHPFTVRLSTLILYLCGLTLLMLFPPGFNRLENWDDSFPLLIGNEATLNKPWNGEFYSLAVFDRALRQKEIQYLDSVSQFHKHPEIVRSLHPAAYYPFVEGWGDTVHDFGFNSAGSNLKANHLNWLKDGTGIRLENGNVMTSVGTVGEIIRSIKTSSGFTLDMLIRTRSLEQIGPARIVTISSDLDNRNVHLGQTWNHLNFRVRTPMSGHNSSRFYLDQHGALPDTFVHRFTAVFNRGFMKIYRDGILLKPLVRGDIEYLPRIIRLGANNTAKTAFCFLSFFPMGVLLGCCFRKRKTIVPLILSACWFSAIQLSYFWKFEQPFGLIFFIGFLVFILLGIVASNRFKNSG